MGVETLSLVAPDDAYQYAFEEYVNMLESWNNLQGITIVDVPETMDDPVGDDDPCYELWNCLLPRICEYFNHELTMKQGNDGIASMRKIRAKSSKPAKMKPFKNQPRGSGNYYFYGCNNEESTEA